MAMEAKRKTSYRQSVRSHELVYIYFAKLSGVVSVKIVKSKKHEQYKSRPKIEDFVTEVEDLHRTVYSK